MVNPYSQNMDYVECASHFLKKVTFGHYIKKFQIKFFISDNPSLHVSHKESRFFFTSSDKLSERNDYEF